MKLLHIITSLERGGAQAVLASITAQMAALGHEQAVIYFHDGPYRDILAQQGIPLYRVQGTISFLDPSGFYRLYRLIKILKPDALHTLLWGANLLGRFVARLQQIPCVMTLHNNLEQNGLVRNMIDRLITYRGATIVAVSSEVRDSFYKHQKTNQPITIIENGIDGQIVDEVDQKNRTKFGLSPDHFVIGSVGRFVPLKQYPLLLDIFALVIEHLPQSRLLIIGAGPQEKSLRAYADQKGIAHAVIWCINQPAYQYYSLFDLFMQTSEKEGISMALLEAMSYGIPPLITYHNDANGIISDGNNGIVAYNKKATDIAMIIINLANSGEVRKKLGSAAQQTILFRFSKTAMIAAYLTLFKDLAEK